MNETPPPDKLVGALASGLAVLRYLCAAPGPVGVTRIARDLDLNASTCFNLVKTLVYEGLVTFDEATKSYSVALGLVAMAKGALEKSPYIQLVRPHLEKIASRYGVTVTLWQRVAQDRVLLIDRADAGGAVRVHMSIGQRLPMYIAALGRCMAAHSGLDESQLRRRLAALRWEDAPCPEQYLADVREARTRGYAVDVGNYVRGVSTVSAVVLDGSARPILAISAVGFTAQLDETLVASLGEELRQRASEVGHAISGRPMRMAATSPSSR